MIIGLEIHVPLNTKTKLFCSCKNNPLDKPNTNVCPICLGFPGSRPFLNKEAVRQALMIAKALNCSINNESFFSRKTYFYPDLPKKFQITQYESPIGINGYIDIGKKIRIKRVHIEEDPGRIIYKQGKTFIDFNRAGSPLVEIVTMPDFENVQEVKAFLELLCAYLSYIGINDPKSKIRVDINISIPPHERVEIKNVMGMSNILSLIHI